MSATVAPQGPTLQKSIMENWTKLFYDSQRLKDTNSTKELIFELNIKILY